METKNQFLTIANLIGEPARAMMLWNLADGRAYTAGELALVSEISPQSASNHLNKLVNADLLKVEKQGKHRYYRFARKEVEDAMDAIAKLIPNKKAIRKESINKNGEIQYCRTCYDHLAGKIAVDLTQSLVNQKILILEDEEFLVNPKKEIWFEKIGINLIDLRKNKRHFAKPCLDWTERKYHLAGGLGAALLLQMKKMNWITAKKNSRILLVTVEGKKNLRELGLHIL
jgi:DNA-binding transcriptional ArsR family regulator